MSACSLDDGAGLAYKPATLNARERSSAVEHTVHIGGVTGSIPVAPTISFPRDGRVSRKIFQNQKL